MAFSVSYVYDIVDKYSATIDKIARKTRSFSSAVSSAGDKVQGMGQKLAGIQSVAGVAGMTLGIKSVIRTFTTFEESMNRLSAITLGTDEQLGRLRGTAKELGKTTQFTASQVAEAMGFLAMAGLDTDQILGAVPGTLELAAAGGIDLASSADIATNVLNQMGFSVKELSRVNDVLALAQSKANFNIMEAFEAMRPVGPTAKNLGMSLEQLTAALGLMAQGGEKGSIAGTLLRNALTEMAGATKGQRKIYKALGIELTDFVDRTGQIKDFAGFIGALEEVQKQGRLTVPVLQALFGERGFRAVQLLVGQGEDALRSFDNTLKGSTGTAAEAAARRMRGLPGVIKSFTSAVEALSIALVESGIDKKLMALGGRATELARALASMDPKTLDTIATIAGLSTAILGALTVFGIFSSVIGSAITAIGALGGAAMKVVPMIGALSKALWALAVGNPIGAIVVAASALMAALIYVIEKFRLVERVIQPVWNWFVKLEAQLLRDTLGIEDASGALNKLGNVLAWIVAPWYKMYKLVKDHGGVWGTMTAAIDSVKAAVEKLIHPLETLKGLLQSVKEFVGFEDVAAPELILPEAHQVTIPTRLLPPDLSGVGGIGATPVALPSALEKMDAVKVPIDIQLGSYDLGRSVSALDSEMRKTIDVRSAITAENVYAVKHATQGRIDGSILVSAEPGASIKRTELKSSVPGNIGFNNQTGRGPLWP